MAKLQKVEHKIPTDESYVFFCPGCKAAHQIYAKGKVAWRWNGSLDKPTFHPSYLCRVGGENPTVCHSWIREGNISFLPDCTHELAGQTVELPEWEGC